MIGTLLILWLGVGLAAWLVWAVSSTPCDSPASNERLTSRQNRARLSKGGQYPVCPM